MDLLGVLAVFVGFAVLTAVAIAGTVDALTQPRRVWTRAGLRRRWWTAQALAIAFPPAIFVYTGLYHTRIRPRLIAAARDFAVERHPRPALAVPTEERASIRMAPSVAVAISSSMVIGYLIAASIVGSEYVSPLVSGSVGTTIVLALNFAGGLTLTRDDLVIRFFGRRRVPWSDVVAISPGSNCGGRYVRLWTRTGSPQRLRVPVTFFRLGRERYEHDLAVLEQWWAASGR